MFEDEGGVGFERPGLPFTLGRDGCERFDVVGGDPGSAGEMDGVGGEVGKIHEGCIGTF